MGNLRYFSGTGLAKYHPRELTAKTCRQSCRRGVSSLFQLLPTAYKILVLEKNIDKVLLSDWVLVLFKYYSACCFEKNNRVSDPADSETLQGHSLVTGCRNEPGDQKIFSVP